MGLLEGWLGERRGDGWDFWGCFRGVGDGAGFVGVRMYAHDGAFGSKIFLGLNKIGSG